MPQEERINVNVLKEGADLSRIYLYTDVNDFKFHPKNRQIDKNNVNFFKKLMLNGGYCSDASILTVDAKTYIIYDGQHRIEAYKQAKAKGYEEPIKVRYINAPDNEEDQIKLIQLLQEGKHWNIVDHIHSHMDGDNDLRKLENFCLEHPWLHRVVKSGKSKGEKSAFMRRGAAIVTGDMVYYKKSLKDGTFKPSKEDWDDAENVYNEVVDILKATRLDTQTDVPALEGIINGWYAVRNDAKMARKMEALPNKVLTVFEFMTPEKMDVRHTTSKDIWKDRFKAAVENAYKKYV